MSRYGLNLSGLYGEHYSGNFNPNIRNIHDGRRSNKSHHCGECAAATKISCFEKLHWAYCLAPTRDDKGNTVICGERFQVASPGGCGTHHYNYGYNLVFKEALRGKDLSPEAKSTLNFGISAEDKSALYVTKSKAEPDSFIEYNKQKNIEARETRHRAKMYAQMKNATKKKTLKLQPAMTLQEHMKLKQGGRLA